jgi:hypothetical protein
MFLKFERDSLNFDEHFDVSYFTLCGKNLKKILLSVIFFPRDSWLLIVPQINYLAGMFLIKSLTYVANLEKGRISGK